MYVGWKVSRVDFLLRAFADVSTGFSMSTVPTANSVETSAKAPIPGIPVSMLTGRRDANKIIEEKHLDIGFKAITFTTVGGFGEGTHELIKEATNDTEWSPNDPWVKPSPKSHAYLTFGFALARANARMLLHADSRRRSAKNRVRTTRPRSATL